MKDFLTSSIDSRLGKIHTVLTALLLKNSERRYKLTDEDIETLEDAVKQLEKVRYDMWRIGEQQPPA